MESIEGIDISHWNYRIIVRGKGKNKIYYLSEVLYDSNGKPMWWDSEESKAIESFDHNYDLLKIQIEHMTKAFKKPILKEIDLKNGKYKLEEI